MYGVGLDVIKIYDSIVFILDKKVNIYIFSSFLFCFSSHSHFFYSDGQISIYN